MNSAMIIAIAVVSVATVSFYAGKMTQDAVCTSNRVIANEAFTEVVKQELEKNAVDTSTIDAIDDRLHQLAGDLAESGSGSESGSGVVGD